MYARNVETEKNWKGCGDDKAMVKGNGTWMDGAEKRIRTTQPRVCLHGNPL